VTVFLSHAWTDQSPERVEVNPRRGLAPRLRDELVSLGVDVFFDDRSIEEFDEIQEQIRTGLAASNLFVGFYSDAYAGRRACHWELSTALAIDPSRVLVVNPEGGIDHVLPSSLRGRLIPRVPPVDDDLAWLRIAELIADRARTSSGVFADVVDPASVLWYGDAPTPFERFVGRADTLWQLDGMLNPPPPAAGGSLPPKAVAVHGLGGIGKTALVCEYAARFGAAYRGGVYWLRLGVGNEAEVDPVDQIRSGMAAQLARIASQISGVPGVAGAEADTVLRPDQIVAEHLSSLPGPYLWILDDVPPGLSAGDLAGCLPLGGTGRVIITTRSTSYAHIPNLALDLMSETEAVELLTRRRTSASEDSAALANRLGFLPLALEVVSTLVALPGTTAKSLLEELGRSDALDLVEEAAANPLTSASATGHALSVSVSFGLSIRRLDPGSFQFLAIASALKVTPIPTQVISRLTGEVDGKAGTRRSLGQLLSMSLLRAVDDDSVELHGLVAEAVLGHVEGPEHFTKRCVHDASLLLAPDLGDVEDITTHLPNSRLAAFGLSLALRSSAYVEAVFDTAALRCIGRFLHVEGRYLEAVEIERRAVMQSAAEQGADSRAALTSRADLALSLAHLGRIREATERLEELAVILNSRYGANDIDTLTIMHNLSSSLVRSDVGRARALGLDVYQRRVEVLGREDSHTLFSLHTLLSMDVVPPEFESASAAYRELIDLRCRTLGENHTTTLTSIMNFSQRLLRQEDPAAAEPWARKALAGRSSYYGPLHPSTLTAKVCLLSVLVSLPDPRKEEIDSLIGELGESATSKDAEKHVPALTMAGEALRRAGRVDDAIPILRVAERLARQGFEPEGLNALLATHNLGGALADAGEVSAAGDLFDQLIPRMESSLGRENRLTMRARRQQALIAGRTGHVDDSLQRLQSLSGHWLMSSGATSPEYAETLADLANAYGAIGRQDLEQHYRKLQQETGAAGRDAGYV
jgi:tetratricopeptide (TPR) repeat protein